MRYWISIKFYGHDKSDWYWHRLCACDSLEDVGIVCRALEASGQSVEARDMEADRYSVVVFPAK